MSTSRTASPVVWAPLSPDKIDWVYAGNEQTDVQRRCVGHLRGDFEGDTHTCFTSWFTHIRELADGTFIRSLQDTFDSLRKKSALLYDYRTMSRLCRTGTPIEDCFGFQTETELALYCLRCIPQRGSYHFYLYAYSRA